MATAVSDTPSRGDELAMLTKAGDMPSLGDEPAMLTKAGDTPSRGDEPAMYLQRPSSARSQDVSHILASTFREYYTREAVPPDTVEYLTTSLGGDDPYHERYVEALRKVRWQLCLLCGLLRLLSYHDG